MSEALRWGSVKTCASRLTWIGILTLLRDSEDGLICREIAEKLGASTQNVRNLLSIMYMAGVLERAEPQHGGGPYSYRLPSELRLASALERST